MEDLKCVACGEIADDGFALGSLCYFCIEEAVTYIIRKKKEKRF